MKIEIFTGPACTYCVQAKALLKLHDMPITDEFIVSTTGMFDYMQERVPGARTIPQIIIDDEHIGGYDDLRLWIDINKGEKMIDRPYPVLTDSLENALRNGVVNLEFKKVDGTTRNMKATLNTAIIFEIENTSQHKSESPTNGVLPVYDVEASGWRSFKVENLLSYSTFDDK